MERKYKKSPKEAGKGPDLKKCLGEQKWFIGVEKNALVSMLLLFRPSLLLVEQSRRSIKVIICVESTRMV